MPRGRKPAAKKLLTTKHLLSNDEDSTSSSSSGDESTYRTVGRQVMKARTSPMRRIIPHQQYARSSKYYLFLSSILTH